MKKILFLSVLASTLIFVLVQCFNKSPQVAEKPKEIKLITHKEGADTLRRDTNAPLKSLVIRPLKSAENYDFCKNNDLSSLFKANNYPRNGFYGEDHYRIEYIFTEVTRDAYNVNVYHVKGKNRHKKVITPFEGEISIIDLATITDPNLNTQEVNEMDVQQVYAASGTFELRESNPNPAYNGVFKGTLKTEFSRNLNAETKAYECYLWYYSENLPSHGAGYRLDGTWTSYTDNVSKPVILADDIFRFGNEILKDFSYGERDVQINPEYRNLGWEDLWTGDDEWWKEAEKPKL